MRRGDFFRDIVLPAAAQSFGTASGGDPELLVNGDFATTDNWDMVGTTPPTITGGKLEFPSTSSSKAALQTLVGGPKPAGNYIVTLDVDFADDDLTVSLLGAGNEVRGSAFIPLDPATGLQRTITASAEFAKFRIGIGGDATATIDNVSLVAA